MPRLDSCSAVVILRSRPLRLVRTTHNIPNQALLWQGNAWNADHALQVAWKAFGGRGDVIELERFGAWAGQESTAQLARSSNNSPPVLSRWTRNGVELRPGRVAYGPAYHALMREHTAAGVHSKGLEGLMVGAGPRQEQVLPADDPESRACPVAAATEGPADAGQQCSAPPGLAADGGGSFVTRAALACLAYQAESGSSCPLTMTAAGILPLAMATNAAIQQGGQDGWPARWLAQWTALTMSRQNDHRDRPAVLHSTHDGAIAANKTGVTLGMSMTEKSSGSDVRMNETTAVPVGLHVDMGQDKAHDEHTQGQPQHTPSSDTHPVSFPHVPSGSIGSPYALHGHKWFTSAPMSDAFLTLAYIRGDGGSDSAGKSNTGGDSSGGAQDEAKAKAASQDAAGPSCFLVPRWLPDGTRNCGLVFTRLKDKLGDRSNASGEVEYHGAVGYLLSTPGRGVPFILDMVVSTRLDCALGSAGLMRQATRAAVHHASQRKAFGRLLMHQPAMVAVLAELIMESRAAVHMAMMVARAFDECGPAWQPVIQRALAVAAADGDRKVPDTAPAPHATPHLSEFQAFRRLATAVTKYWVTKRAVGIVAEGLECMGGNGYTADWDNERWYRQAPLNSLWEGSGNVMCLDVLRTLTKDRVAGRVFVDRCRQAVEAAAEDGHVSATTAVARLQYQIDQTETMLQCMGLLTCRASGQASTIKADGNSSGQATAQQPPALDGDHLQLHARTIVQHLALCLQGAAFATAAACDAHGHEGRAFQLWCDLRLPQVPQGKDSLAGTVHTGWLPGVIGSVPWPGSSTDPHGRPDPQADHRHGHTHHSPDLLSLMSSVVHHEARSVHGARGACRGADGRDATGLQPATPDDATATAVPSDPSTMEEGCGPQGHEWE